MTVTITAGDPAINLRGLGDLAGDGVSTSIRHLNVSNATLADGKIAFVGTFDPSGAPDQYFLSIFDPATNAATTATLAARYAHVSRGASANSLLVVTDLSTSDPKVQTVNFTGVATGAATSIFNGLGLTQPSVFDVDSLDGGGFGITYSAMVGGLSQRGFMLIDTSGNRIANIPPSAMIPNTVDASSVASARLANGNLLLVWSLNGNSGGGMEFQLYNAAGAAIGSKQSIYTGAASSTFQNVWRAGDVEIAETHDGGFVIARGVDFQHFGADGQPASQRGLMGGTRIEDIEWTADGKLLVYAEGTSVNGHAIGVFGLNPVSGNLPTFASVATLAYKPNVPAATGALASLSQPLDPVVRLPDGNFFSISSATYMPSGSAIRDAALVGQEIVYTTTDPALPGGGNDVIVGTSVGETLDGLGGNDTIRGLGGDDTLVGGAGADAIDGGDGFDAVSFAAAPSGGTVNLDVGAGVGGDVQGDAYVNVEAALGSAFADVLVGRGGVANTLDGGAGDDVIYGEGLDTVVGGAGSDVFFGGQGGAINIELSAAGIETIWGSVTDDVFSGSFATANLVLIGQGGADRMAGGQGNDFLYFDHLDAVVAGDGGNDWAVATLSTAGVTLNMATAAIESAWGSTQGDTLNGAGSGVGLVIIGDLGNDVITGGNAADFLYGFGGNDRIKGGLGNDQHSGNAGNDTFVYDAAPSQWGVDTIWDFARGADKINLAGSGFTSFAQLAITQSGAHSVVRGTGGGQIWVLNNATLDAGDFLFA